MYSVYTSYAMLSCGILWNIPQYHTRAFTQVCISTGKVTSGTFHGIVTREHCITILYHAIENTVANTINAKYALHIMGMLACILIRSIFYSIVESIL